MGSPEGGEQQDLVDLARLRSLFLACDLKGSGRIERDDFGSLCAELRVRPAEAEAIFQRLDTDRDGAITFPEFARAFRGATQRRRQRQQQQRRGGPGEGWAQEGQAEGQESPADAVDALDVLAGGAMEPSQAWREFELRLGEEAGFIPRQEQVSVLYQNISIVEPRLIQPYEHVIKNFIREIKLQSTEMESLAIAVKRAQDKAAMQLSELEEEMDQRIQAAEHKIKKEEKRKAEETLNDLKQKYESEVGDLQVTVKKLKMLEEQSKNINHKGDLVLLKNRIHDLTLDNQKLKKDLMEAQTNISFLQSELDTLKSDLADQSLNSERSANRKLYDSNDGLRSALENSWSIYNRSLRLTNSSPGNTVSRNKCNGGQSPQNTRYDRSSHSSCVDEDFDSLALCDPMQRISCEVDSLPESCFDSGLSTLRDSNEYDSEVESKHQRTSQRSQCPQESIAGDASDTDVPDIRDEEVYSPDEVSTVLDWKPCQPVSRSSSGASTRKCISAISPQSDSRDYNSRYPSSEKAYRIVLAGDAAVGKSSFLMRLCKNEFRGNTSATLGVDFQMKRLIVDGEPTVLQLWDTAGQERFRSIAKSYFRRADGVLLLYDVTCEKSFLNVREWVEMIEDATHENIPIMVIGNKADLRPVAYEQGEKCVPVNYGEKLAMAYSALFCETSAKDGSNIVEAVLHLAREVRKRSDSEDDNRSVTDLTGTTTKRSTNTKNCCNI
ncbi:ras and EF-hand domain-containing protein isoform X2 [Sphaerodactylus townsendi]|uniref:ras and EF-hand domain-containing protein isoform X2 n=1 Tax=Sphaerodactylus townsendi TaxID=933632 RepID=UPI002025EB0D|nr:ras and EF-hand domain-containing protein isoform X2 [Sphaerodactylus townsendi]